MFSLVPCWCCYYMCFLYLNDAIEKKRTRSCELCQYEFWYMFKNEQNIFSDFLYFHFSYQSIIDIYFYSVHWRACLFVYVYLSILVVMYGCVWWKSLRCLKKSPTINYHVYFVYIIKARLCKELVCLLVWSWVPI